MKPMYQSPHQSQLKSPEVHDFSLITVKDHCLSGFDSQASESAIKLLEQLPPSYRVILDFVLKFYWKEFFSFTQKHISKQTGISVRTIQRALDHFSKQGWIMKSQPYPKATNVYKFVRSAITPELRKEIFLSGKSRIERALFLSKQSGGLLDVKKELRNSYTTSESLPVGSNSFRKEKSSLKRIINLRNISDLKINKHVPLDSIGLLAKERLGLDARECLLVAMKSEFVVQCALDAVKENQPRNAKAYFMSVLKKVAVNNNDIPCKKTWGVYAEMCKKLGYKAFVKSDLQLKQEEMARLDRLRRDQIREIRVDNSRPIDSKLVERRKRIQNQPLTPAMKKVLSTQLQPKGTTHA